MYAYGWEWANAGNTPFRKYKRYTHEGGIATPFIVRWPEVIEPGGLTDTVGHIIDIMPTCVEVAGAGYPGSRQGHEILPMEGSSLTPILQHNSDRPDFLYCWEHQGHRGVRQNRWKLVSSYPENTWELYDMIADRTEVHNLINDEPEKSQALQDIYHQWTDRVGVVPWSEIRG